MITDISMVAVTSLAVEDIKPYPFNNKKHPPRQIEILAKSIATQGLLDPIVVDGNYVIISGHGRLEAIKKLGWTRAPARVLTDISEALASALRIAANKTASNEYDTDALSREVRILAESEMDISSLGFDEKELSLLIEDVGELDQDSLAIDMNAAVEDHEEAIATKAKETDAKLVRLDRAFGFKFLAIKDQKTITRFMAEVEAETGVTGSEALLSHMRAYLNGDL